jgi:hypothetical protein
MRDTKGMNIPFSTIDLDNRKPMFFHNPDTLADLL